jgi:chemotaxis protein methyltransferase CheR
MTLPVDEFTFQDLLRSISHMGILDLSYYREHYIQRLINARMERLKLFSYRDYLDRLKHMPEEYNMLVYAIGTNVTEFFRDPDVFQLIKDSVLPDLLKRNRPLRIWSACCATGEEPYSIAMLIHEVLGSNVNRHDIRIFGTDVDSEALMKAQKGIYKGAAVEKLSNWMKAKYFVENKEEQYIAIKSDIKAMVAFSQLELISGNYLNNIQLLLCRNMLIYIRHNLQPKIFEKLSASLQKGAYLIIGKTETLPLSFSDSFEQLHSNARIYRRL